MRALHVVPSYLPARRYGGPVFATHALCAALAAQGCDVTVFTTSADGSQYSDVLYGVPVPMDGVKVWYFRSTILRRLYYSAAMAHALKSRCGDFDLLHLHSIFLWPTAAAAAAARRRGIPYLVSPRGMLVKDLIVRKSSWAKTAWIRFVERRNLERAAGIHATSAAEAEQMRDFRFSLPPIHEVPNGVSDEPEKNDAVPLPELAAKTLGSGRPVVLFLGRINWKKGLDRLIPAMARVPGADLLVAGNDEEGYTERLAALAVEAGVRERVVFCGPVYGSAKREIYRRATVFVLPSYSENFGNVVLEAMLEGCPVVVTPEVGAAAIVERSGGGWVTAGDPEALAASIRRALADPAARAESGRRGQLEMRGQYSWASVASQIMQIYSKIVAEARSARK